MVDKADEDRERRKQKPRRELLALMRPGKPIAEMTDAELNAFADELCERMLARYERLICYHGDGRSRHCSSSRRLASPASSRQGRWLRIPQESARAGRTGPRASSRSSPYSWHKNAITERALSPAFGAPTRAARSPRNRDRPAAAPHSFDRRRDRCPSQHPTTRRRA